MSFQRAREVFLNFLDDPLVLSRIARPGASMCEQPSFFRSFPPIARMKFDAELLLSDDTRLRSTRRHRTTPSPLTVRASLHDLRELSQLFRRQARLGTFWRTKSMRPSGPKALKR